MKSRTIIGFLILPLLLSSLAHAAWLNGGAAWKLRRSLDVIWDAERATGDEIAIAEFHTAGQHQPDGQNVCVATNEGNLVPSRVLMVGPGDQVRIIFSLVKGVRRYYVYFGNPAAPPPARTLDEKKIRGGLLMEMREFPGGAITDFDRLRACWDRSTRVIGRTMIAQPFLGLNPFGSQDQTITRFTGWLFVPMDGQYQFAASAHSTGALYLDDKPLVFVPRLVGDIRFKATVQLSRGWHSFLFLHATRGGDGRFSVVWIRPDSKLVQILPRESFGLVRRGAPGPLEELNKTLIADFTLDYLGECFVAGNYSHRYRFSACGFRPAGRTTSEWDFGDGQKSTQSECEHVYLQDGIYSVRYTSRIGVNSDTRTTRIAVSRNYEHLDNPPTDPASKHSSLIEAYDLSAMPTSSLPGMARLHLKAGNLTAAPAVAAQLALRDKLTDPDDAMQPLLDIQHELLGKQEVDPVVEMWKKFTPASPLHFQSQKQLAQVLLWWKGDFNQAAAILQSLVGKNDPYLKRLFGQALILNQNAEKGSLILRELPAEGNPDREPVLSGAAARSVEYFISEGDWESGEKQWEKWQTQYPADFLGGYSALLRVRLIETRKMPKVAALVAEAFAQAVPASSYSPQLLATASKILAELDPEKSANLRALLKKRYPEDPLAQDQPDKPKP